MSRLQPATGREHRLPDGLTLVSVTDLKGRITYANRAFIEVSGYSEAELLGQPHNIVRHPDMPAAAFKDLWDTLQAGRPWTAPVKNRRKNGDHYWVLANATPMRDGPHITGYLSVRVAAPRDMIEAAEAGFTALKGPNPSLVLREGRFFRSGWPGRLQALWQHRPGRHSWIAGLALVGSGASAATLLPSPWALPAAGALALAGALSMEWLLARRLQDLVHDARRLGAGDLAHDVGLASHGPLRDLQLALRQVGLNLRSVVWDARQDIDGLRQAMKEIGAGSLDLSERTERQAGHLQQTASAMEEIHATVSQSADSARDGSARARDTATVAQHSHRAVTALTQGMSDIQAATERIAHIIQVVEGVAFQTNLLALNAAVEAARAGESGRGFAVVAAEVRTLAGRAADAAKQVRDVIQASRALVDQGSQHGREAQQRMDDALTAVRAMDEALQSIAASAQEQGAGIRQVNESVTELDGVTQQNVALVEQLSAATQAMLERVEQVSIATRLFRLRPGEQTLSQLDAVSLRRTTRSN
ncbi:methyl-accepting chemotaxis protein [Inhella gelatinilytica]|uniref:PAS domain S-box protein n=1 Tax=Inhella gelatinilytica TaxID=2795030 RepID=A0A931IW33_9BURK|nr:methyl-accepting chemotaxis protein [Inhella gelatinilytica]MBH9552075.1 PAS domain S-box protein [Inhella gelatinilytica]